MFKIIIPVLLLIFGILSTIINHRATDIHDKHFTLLAQSFYKNDLFLNPLNLPDGDFADFKGRQYIFYGPAPAIILVPFVAIFGLDFPQYTISIFSLILVYIGTIVLCKKLKFSNSDSMWLANFLVFGTVLGSVGSVNISAYLVQTLGVVFVVLSMVEYFSKRRWLVIGFLCAAAGLTRINLYCLVIFYLIEIFISKKSDIKNPLIGLLIPVFLSMALLGMYNHRRFGSFTDSGYTHNIHEIHTLGNNNKLGYFNPIHAPAKLYLLLFASPEPLKRDDVEYVLKFPYLKASGYGMAMWFTSPLFIYLILSKRKHYTLSAVISIVFLSIPAFLFSGTGSSQFGYRYSLDFIPLLFIILLSAFKNGLPKLAKILIFVGILFNSFYMLSMWGTYPLFFWLK